MDQQTSRFTKKQKQMYDFIAGFIDQHDYSPTFREIATGLDYKSVATVAKHIDNLVAGGWLVKTDRVGRSLELANRVKKQLTINQELIDHLRKTWPKLSLEQQNQARQTFTDLEIGSLVDEITKLVEK